MIFKIIYVQVSLVSGNCWAGSFFCLQKQTGGIWQYTAIAYLRKYAYREAIITSSLTAILLCSAILFYLPDNFQRKRLQTCLLFIVYISRPSLFFSSVYKVANACILLVSDKNTIKWKQAIVRNVASGSRIYTPAGIYDFIRDSRKSNKKEHRRMFQGWRLLRIHEYT